MRLICPNCGAQYEVDDSLIPDAGRDVQCSNCGHAWFQMPAHLDTDLSEELGLEPIAPKDEPLSPPPTEPDPVPPPTPQRAPLDPTIRSILSEEGAREAQARRSEPLMEAQGDLGLGEAAARGAGSRERLVRMREQDEERAETIASAASAAAASSRRDLLPDIEEINSSLRSADERGGGDVRIADEPGPARRRSGFGVGFMLVVLVAVVGMGVYMFADLIAAQVPGSEGALDAYVAWIDGVRLWLETLAQDWVQRLSRMVDTVKEDPAG
jgi:predicted Zn finger-like uncharacterized protein